MGIQARLSEADPRLFNPGRDLAHNFGDICRITEERLTEGSVAWNNWPFLRNYCKIHRVEQADIGEAVRTFLEFVATSTDSYEEKNPAQAMHRVGWDKVKPAAQLVFLGVMGTVVMGYFYAGVREATMQGEGPTLTCQDLIDSGRRTSRILLMPAWRRPFSIWRYRARLWLLRRLGAEPSVSPLVSHLDYDAKLKIVQERQRRRTSQQFATRKVEDAAQPE